MINPINLGLKIPALAELSPEASAQLVEGINSIIALLEEKGAIPPGAKFDALVNRPGHMQIFISRFRENRDIGENIVVSESGKPVTDDKIKLVCGLSLARVERWLVYACAEKAFADVLKDTAGKFPEEIKNYLVYAWQLPLLDVYKRENVSIYFRELGQGMLLLKTPAAVEAIVTTDIADVRKTREAIGDRFEEMLKEAPRAVKVLAHCESRQFEFYERLLGDKIWKFFGGNQQLVIELLALDAKRVLALGPFFTDLCMETFRVLEEVPTKTLAPLMKSFNAVFGGPGRALLGDGQFANEFLRQVVDDFRGMEVKSDKEIEAVSEAAAMKWNVIKPKLAEWFKNRNKPAGKSD